MTACSPALARQLEHHRVLGMIDRVERRPFPARLNAPGGIGVSSTFGCMPTGVALMITSPVCWTARTR